MTVKWFRQLNNFHFGWILANCWYRNSRCVNEPTCAKGGATGEGESGRAERKKTRMGQECFQDNVREDHFISCQHLKPIQLDPFTGTFSYSFFALINVSLDNMVNQTKKAGLGRTLQKAQRVASRRRNPRVSTTARHTIEDKTDERVDLKSVIAQSNLEEFLEEAELAGKQFETVHQSHLKVITQGNSVVQNDLIEDPEDEYSLTVPRRPHWDESTTPEQLDEMERRSFLVWRKKLAKLQEKENVTLTPFEKNLEIWRQLWRVIERSDIVVQILDCRNPLLYLCDDLIKYVHEEFGGKKMNLLLLNKADFLTPEQRRMWANYFKERNIQVMFFSALYENDNLKNTTSETSENESEKDGQEESSSGNSSSDEEEQNVTDQMKNNLNIVDEKSTGMGDGDKIYNKFKLIDKWRDMWHKLNADRGELDGESDTSTSRSRHTSENATENGTFTARPLTVGLVGYPNVGKSSTINALLSAKRVAVSATPGKTKHFQTFLIDRDMMLCDCPGLVFPNFVSSKSEMVINGVLPIDQMKDSISPVRFIVDRIPRGFFEDIYGLAFEQDAKQNLTAEDLLNAFGFMRGYMTARGLPDVSRASRVICKDYINGKILHCEPPPNVDRKLYYNCSKLAEAMKKIELKMQDPKYALKITERQRRLMKQAKGTDITSKDFDAQYFLAKTEGYHIKGLPGIGNLTQPVGKFSELKMAKREKKHKKKEKLRRVYKHLDE